MSNVSIEEAHFKEHCGRQIKRISSVAEHSFDITVAYLGFHEGEENIAVICFVNSNVT